MSNKKHQQLHADAIFAGADSLRFQYGGFVNKAIRRAAPPGRSTSCRALAAEPMWQNSNTIG